MPVLEVKPTPADLILSGDDSHDDSRMDALTTEVSDMAYDLREAVDAILPPEYGRSPARALSLVRRLLQSAGALEHLLVLNMKGTK